MLLPAKCETPVIYGCFSKILSDIFNPRCRRNLTKTAYFTVYSIKFYWTFHDFPGLTRISRAAGDFF